MYSYLEDRRPAANIDPYLVAASLVDIICLNGNHVEGLKNLLYDSVKPFDV